MSVHALMIAAIFCESRTWSCSQPKQLKKSYFAYGEIEFRSRQTNTNRFQESNWNFLRGGIHVNNDRGRRN
jgi:hypothetical protein